MKPNLLNLLLLIAVCVSGCAGNKSSAPAPTLPTGTFAGQFRLVHTNKLGVRDTARANLQLALSQATGYKVTGDTAAVHAGSYGGYSISSNNLIDFQDKTYPASGTPTKTHLYGVYNYYYDGTVLQMVANSYLDTLSLQYDLKRVN